MEETALSFEDALKKLEGIVRDLQSGDAPLEKSLEMFKEGTALVKYCSSLLDNAEREIKKIVQSADGTVREEDFDQN